MGAAQAVGSDISSEVLSIFSIFFDLVNISQLAILENIEDLVGDVVSSTAATSFVDSAYSASNCYTLVSSSCCSGTSYSCSVIIGVCLKSLTDIGWIRP